MVLMPIWSASNSCWREKRAMASFERASTSSWASRWASNCELTREEQRRRLLELGPLGGMARGDVADLMRHDGGDFGRVVGEREKAAGDENIAGGQGEGVDDRRIQHRDAVGLARRRPRPAPASREPRRDKPGSPAPNRRRRTPRSAAFAPDWPSRPRTGAARAAARR